MKKILFFTHCLVGGGAEKTIINLAAYINENYTDYEAHIAVVYDDETVHRQMKNVHVLAHRTTPEMSKIKKIPIVISQARDLKKLKKELRPYACISFLPGADFLNALSKGKEKMIVSVRNKESFFCKSVLQKKYIQYCYHKCDRIIAISERVRTDIIEYFGVNPMKVQTIYNPIPQITFTDERKEEYKQLLEQNKRIVITAGRLTRQKGQGHLIRSFSLLVKEVADAHLVILGKGELENSLKKLAQELGIEKNITFLGFVPNPQDYIKKAQLFAFSSIVEGLGNILVEALACECPIVSTDCDCGPREILAPRTKYDQTTQEVEYAEFGVLVPVCSGENLDAKVPISREETKMADTIKAVLLNEKIRENYSKKSKKRWKDFEINVIVSKWLESIEI